MPKIEKITYHFAELQITREVLLHTHEESPQNFENCTEAQSWTEEPGEPTNVPNKTHVNTLPDPWISSLIL